MAYFYEHANFDAISLDRKLGKFAEPVRLARTNVATLGGTQPYDAEAAHLFDIWLVESAFCPSPICEIAPRGPANLERVAEDMGWRAGLAVLKSRQKWRISSIISQGLSVLKGNEVGHADLSDLASPEYPAIRKLIADQRPSA